MADVGRTPPTMDHLYCVSYESI